MTEISPRERQVGTLIAQGLSNVEIGVELGITRSTVDSTRQRLYLKVGVDNAVDLTHYAIAHGWVKVKGRAGRPRKAT
jgi:two-component system invasion response regulator UvrY